MRYITIGKAVLVPGTRKSPDGREEAGLFPFNLLGWNQQEVWPNSFWRDSEENSLAFYRIYEAFEGAKEGSVVALENSDYEKYLPVATRKGQPGIGPEIMQLLRPVIMAPTTAPEKLEDIKATPEKKTTDTAPVAEN